MHCSSQDIPRGGKKEPMYRIHKNTLCGDKKDVSSGQLTIIDIEGMEHKHDSILSYCILTSLYGMVTLVSLGIIGYTLLVTACGYAHGSHQAQVQPMVVRGLLASVNGSSSFLDTPTIDSTVIVSETASPVPATNTPFHVSAGMSHSWNVPNNGTIFGGSTGMATGTGAGTAAGTGTAILSGTAIISATGVRTSKTQAPGYPGKPEISNVETSAATCTGESSTGMGIGFWGSSMAPSASLMTLTYIPVSATRTLTSTSLHTVTVGPSDPVGTNKSVSDAVSASAIPHATTAASEKSAAAGEKSAAAGAIISVDLGVVLVLLVALHIFF